MKKNRREFFFVCPLRASTHVTYWVLMEQLCDPEQSHWLPVLPKCSVPPGICDGNIHVNTVPKWIQMISQLPPPTNSFDELKHQVSTVKFHHDNSFC